MWSVNNVSLFMYSLHFLLPCIYSSASFPFTLFIVSHFLVLPTLSPSLLSRSSYHLIICLQLRFCSLAPSPFITLPLLCSLIASPTINQALQFDSQCCRRCQQPSLCHSTVVVSATPPPLHHLPLMCSSSQIVVFPFVTLCFYVLLDVLSYAFIDYIHARISCAG